MRERTSFSELSTLADCERKWHYKYGLWTPTEQSNAMHLGTIMHTLTGEWWEGTKWTATFDRLLREAGQQLALTEPWITAEWLMDRYAEHYRASRDNKTIRVIGRELKASIQVPGTDVTIVAYWDQLVLDDEGRLWLVERKTMNDWSRLESLAVDPQVTQYIWMARQLGLPVTGVLYDAIRTYRWKRDEHPPADSFQVLWLDRTDEQCAAAVEEMRAGILRRAMLGAGVTPLRNIGRNCNTCWFRDQCWEDLCFPQGIEITE